MRVLCVYATRQIDSNLFMSSTKFDGLQKCGYHVDMIFCSTETVCKQFESRYSHYFNRVYYITLRETGIGKYLRNKEKFKVLYTFYREFLMDSICPPIKVSNNGMIKELLKLEYDCILSFIPTVLSGILAHKIHINYYPKARLIQYWTDPLSLGRCDTIYERPKSRWFHGVIEKSLLGYGDKIVFCYPLLCDSMKNLYPEYADKMTWSDTSYIKHEKANFKPHNEKITIGCFGAYQKRVRNIQPYLESMSHFPDVNFIIRGDSDIVIDKQKYPNLDVEGGRQPIEIIEDMEANCDILVCLAGLSGLTIPAGKVFYYGDYNKPILYISDGKNKDYASQYISGFDRYVVCDNTVNSIVEGINECIRILPNYQVSIPERMRPEVIAKNIIEEIL